MIQKYSCQRRVAWEVTKNCNTSVSYGTLPTCTANLADPCVAGDLLSS